MDFDIQSGTWLDNKVRGHGVVSITIEDLVFAIPVRSYIKHDAALILEVNRRNRSVKGMGLDYTKALLIKDQSHISDNIFVLRSKKAGKKLKDKEAHVKKQFTKYVKKYITAVRTNDQAVLGSYEYIHTTLINYHTELKI